MGENTLQAYGQKGERNMKAQRVYLNDQGQAKIRCPECGREKIFDMSRYGHYVGVVKVRCACSSEFRVVLERRMNFRKEVHLPADYSVIEPGEDVGQMVVTDLSRNGVGFRTTFENQLKPDDIVVIKLVPDDVRWDLDGTDSHIIITKKLIVRHVRGRIVGARFCDDNIGKLARYL
jgi:hypothetical protein